MEIKYYDERCYLFKFDKETIEINKLLRTWQSIERQEVANEMINNEELINMYKSYIKKVSNLINSITQDNSITKSLLLTILLKAGTFSYDKYIYSNEKDILKSYFGLNIVLGNGCCRNVSGFINDILTECNTYSKTIPVFATNISDSVNAYKNKANHMVNLIKYNNTLYVYDPCFDVEGSLFKFISELKMQSYDDEKTYLFYKPYLDYVLNNIKFEDISNIMHQSSIGSPISLKEYIDLIKETDYDFTRHIDFVKDFMLDTRKDTLRIKEKVLKK